MPCLFVLASLFSTEHSFTIFLVSLLLSAFIICYLWVRKTSPFSWKQIPMALGLTVMSTPVLLIVVVITFFFSEMYYPQYKFSSERWMNNTEKRYQYSKSIIKSKMLIGKTKEEVKELLGEYGGGDDEDTWYYYIGTPPGLFVLDPYTLAVNFKDGRVIEVTQSES